MREAVQVTHAVVVGPLSHEGLQRLAEALLPALRVIQQRHHGMELGPQELRSSMRIVDSQWLQETLHTGRCVPRPYMHEPLSSMPSCQTQLGWAACSMFGPHSAGACAAPDRT